MTPPSVLTQATRKVLEPFARAQDATGPAWDEELWRQVDAHGFGLVGVPEQMGGAGGTLEAASEVVRVAGALALPLSLVEGIVAQWILASAGLPVRSAPTTLFVEPPGAARSPLCRERGSWQVASTLARIPWARHATSVVVVAADAAGHGPAVARLDPLRLRLRVGLNAAGEERDDVEAGSRCLETIPLPPGGPSLEDVRRRARVLQAIRLLAAVEALHGSLPAGARPPGRWRAPGAARTVGQADVSADLALAGAALERAVALDAEVAELPATVRHVGRVARSVLAAAGDQARAGRVYRVARCWLQELLSGDGAPGTVPSGHRQMIKSPYSSGT